MGLELLIFRSIKVGVIFIRYNKPYLPGGRGHCSRGDGEVEEGILGGERDEVGGGELWKKRGGGGARWGRGRGC